MSNRTSKRPIVTAVLAVACLSVISLHAQQRGREATDNATDNPPK